MLRGAGDTLISTLEVTHTIYSRSPNDRLLEASEHCIAGHAALLDFVTHACTRAATLRLHKPAGRSNQAVSLRAISLERRSRRSSVRCWTPTPSKKCHEYRISIVVKDPFKCSVEP